MLRELSVSTVMVALTVIIHGAGLTGVRRLYYLGVRLGTAHPLSAIAVTVATVLGLFAVHGVEIWLYALFYLLLGAVPTLAEAVYASTITYGAIGYGDVAVAQPWRLVAAIEGINGVMLIGWSTAFFVTMMARLQRHRRR